jgi:hypothetical protein
MKREEKVKKNRFSSMCSSFSSFAICLEDGRSPFEEQVCRAVHADRLSIAPSPRHARHCPIRYPSDGGTSFISSRTARRSAQELFHFRRVRIDFLVFLKERDEIIERNFQTVLKTSVLASLLNETECFEPFDIEELSYKII